MSDYFNLPAITRYRLMSAIGAIFLLLTGLARMLSGEEEGITEYSRYSALACITFFVGAGHRLEIVQRNPHRAVFASLLPLLVHLLLLGAHQQLAAEIAIAELVLFTVTASLIDANRWQKCHIVTWTCGMLISAWTIVNPQISPITFTALVLLISVCVYVLSASFFLAKQNLQLQDRRLKAVQEFAGIGGWEYDLLNDTANWSDTAYNVFDLPVNSGQPPDIRKMVLGDHDKSELFAAMDLLFKSGEAFDVIEQVHTATGRLIWLHCRGHVITQNNVPVRAMGVFSDVSERMDKEQALTLAKEEAEAAVIARSQFIANMSHEIRTPMNGVIGMASLLAADELEPQHRSYVDIITSCSETLLTIINDILDFSKLDAGKLELDNQPFELAELIESASHVVRKDMDEKGLTFRLDIPSIKTIVGDENRLRQVFVNLISNATKFTASGGITVAVNELRRSTTQTTLYIGVQDTGIGIDAATQENLFQAFTQADASTTRKFGGTGLGLAICQSLIVQMGGCIRIDSRAGEGATFSFELTFPFASPSAKNKQALNNGGLHKTKNKLSPSPLPMTSALKQAPKTGAPRLIQNTSDFQHAESKVESTSTTPKAKILLAEDNPVNQQVALGMLKKVGLSAKVAKDGNEAVHLASAEAFDIVLMDLQMPNLDGIGATQQIRALTAIQQPKIIALTANAMFDDREKCIAAGMDDFIAKPVRLHDLQEKIMPVIQANQGD